jgi:hypothetical protein
VEGSARRSLAWLILAAGVVALALGAADVVVWLGPLGLIAALLLSGRFIGEDRIVRRWEAMRPLRRIRPARARWRPLAARPVVSLLERRPHLERGPPAPALA